jgi:hypothetical protein
LKACALSCAQSLTKAEYFIFSFIEHNSEMYLLITGTFQGSLQKIQNKKHLKGEIKEMNDDGPLQQTHDGAF